MKSYLSLSLRIHLYLGLYISLPTHSSVYLYMCFLALSCKLKLSFERQEIHLDDSRCRTCSTECISFIFNQ